jgi:ATP-dependent RNA helicase DeaD
MKFEELNISKEVKKGLLDSGFTEMFPIQEKTIHALLEHKDVIGKAKSGSGKTLAFLVPILENIKRDKGLQALIMAPTRELAIQIDGVLKKISRHKHVKSALVYGGKAMGAQTYQLRTANIIIATPGRLIDHMQRKNVDLKHVKFVILDEADRMLDMGFIRDIDFILKHTNPNRQTLLFSATMSEQIRSLVHRFMKSPVSIELHKEEPTVLSVKQEAYLAKHKDKPACLKYILDKEKPSLCLIFVQRKHEAKKLVRVFSKYFNIAAIHGNLSQSQRERVLTNFRNRRIQFLIATDVAARGIDIPAVSHVINYDMPQEIETFIHRVGRTGRAGASGRAIMIALPSQENDLRALEHYAKIKIKIHDYSEEVSKEKAAQLKEQVGGAGLPPVQNWVRGRPPRRHSFYKQPKHNFGRH